MRHGASSWHRPYAGEEGIGFGQGDGTARGELEGTVAWANYPRRREDGVWTPNLRGTITTGAGDDVLVSIHGQSVEESAPGSRRAILARVELTTDTEGWRWLNTWRLVGLGASARAAERRWCGASLDGGTEGRRGRPTGPRPCD